MFGECVYLFKSTIDRSMFCKVRTHAVCILTSCRASILSWNTEGTDERFAHCFHRSRRFICIKVTAPVDTNVSANCRQLYAQVLTLIYHGGYWQGDKDRVILYQSNQEFEQISPLEEFCCCFFYRKGRRWENGLQRWRCSLMYKRT